MQLTLYQNGVVMFSGPLRSFTDLSTQRSMNIESSYEIRYKIDNYTSDDTKETWLPLLDPCFIIFCWCQSCSVSQSLTALWSILAQPYNCWWIVSLLVWLEGVKLLLQLHWNTNVDQNMTKLLPCTCIIIFYSLCMAMHGHACTHMSTSLYTSNIIFNVLKF